MKAVAAAQVMVVAAVMVAAPATADDPLLEQDPAVLRFIERSIAWYPGSVFRLVADERTQTPSGSYRRVTVERTCDNENLNGQPSVIIDEVTGLAYLGSVGELPFDQTGTSPRSLRPFIEGFLPTVLETNMNMKVRVSWDVPDGTEPGSLIPFTLNVDTGYGEFPKPVAVTSDGRFLVMAAGLPLDSDPVAYRRELFRSSPSVVWDSGSESGEVEIVEFSDLECPFCRVKWAFIKTLMENDSSIRHGMVSFPITSIHPWAFRASSAQWCIGEQQIGQVIPFKEVFYDLQREMEVSLVTPTAIDFVAGNGLDEETFRACYLRSSSLNAVHDQLTLGHTVGVIGTPSYFVNGWKIRALSDELFVDLVKRLGEGGTP
jgi:protein-disulfide isomerase